MRPRRRILFGVASLLVGACAASDDDDTILDAWGILATITPA